MRKNYPYLKDSAFLQSIDKLQDKEQYVKINLLDFSEELIEEINGRITGGNINLDGASSMRRTCNLTMVAQEYKNDLTNINNLISINKKISLEVGFLNTTEYYKNFDIIWFPLGIYVIINASISSGTSGVTISLQLKDKMCLLNGECGGVIPASTIFHEYETINENGEYIVIKPTIYQIIQEAVNHFGGESLNKIIISDLDTKVRQVMKWAGKDPLYIIKGPTPIGSSLNLFHYSATTDKKTAEQIQTSNADSVIITYEHGNDIGYIYTDFTYPGELIADAGNSVCDVLDKIKGVLGNYEYFYDVDGNFVFQEIKNYLNTSHATVELNKTKDDYVTNYLVDSSKGKSVYTFDDSMLVTSYSNAPQYNMIKNDFIVWGMRKGIDGKTLPLRYHLAIDQKPKVGNAYQVFFYEDKEDHIKKAKCPLVFPSMGSFPSIGVQGVFYMDNYSKEIYEWDFIENKYNKIEVNLQSITTNDWRTELYLSGSASDPLGTDSNYYYPELKNEWPKIYDVENGKFFDTVLKYPSDINFYLDFIDTGADISEMSVLNIGRRTKVINDDKINCVFEPEIPNLILLDQSIGYEELNKIKKEYENRGIEYVELSSDLFAMVSSGGQFNSAYNMVRELLYQYTSYNESITVSAIPIFYLEPNLRITVRDKVSGIYGDYMINSISLPLDITNIMTLSCRRAIERI